MLVLSRKKNESIVLDNKIEIVVVEISEDRVRLGIKAPRDVEVHRKEVYQRIAREMREAAQNNPQNLADDIFSNKKK